MPASPVEPAVSASGLSLGRPVPNPAAGASRLAFTLAEPGEVELAVFDAGGRRVRLLRSGSFPAGRHEAIWNGADEAGREVAAGLYFARLIQRGVARTARIVRRRPA